MYQKVGKICHNKNYGAMTNWSRLKKIPLILFYILLVEACTDSGNQITLLENKIVETEVRIPEGKYLCTDDQPAGREHKTKFGKFLNTVAEAGKDEIFLSKTIFVNDNRIISSTVSGSKEMTIDQGGSKTDSIFFIKVFVVNSEHTAEVRMLPGNRLRISLLNREMNYQLQ
jgi:hypothetical protein